ncbi:hypothetical protein N9H82_06060 [Flavobacteriaceae bacterium]|nr:hypothetical protein [Flavobacteriaceae bacterium]
MRQTNTQEYANGLAQMSNWKSTVTIRPSYKLKPHTSDRLIERISKRLRTRVFYTMEKDWNDEMYHLHLLLDKNVADKQLSQASGLNLKAIKYNEPIKSKQAISGYIVKQLNDNHSHHNVF